MSWIGIVIGAHFLNALVFVLDKFLLENFFKRSTVYATWIALFGLLSVFLIPFGFSYPGILQVCSAFLAGILFVIALILFFEALRRGEASRVVPIVGALVPIATFFISYWLLGKSLSLREFWAFCLLVIGSILITLPPRKASHCIHLKSIAFAIGGAVAFAAAFVATKYVFEHQSFISGFIWMRLGSAIAGLRLLVLPEVWSDVKEIFGKFRSLQGLLFFGNQCMGAFAFFLLSYAISRADVTLVNALQGVQYVFLLLLVAMVSFFFPTFLKESFSPVVVVQKIASVLLIGGGLYLIAFA